MDSTFVWIVMLGGAAVAWLGVLLITSERELKVRRREVEALLAKLVCPVTRTPLRYDREAQELISDAAGLAFPIRDGVPVMLVEEARTL